MSDGADLDIRWPIGLLFSVLGVVLLVYGAAAPHRTVYRPDLLGPEHVLNLNLWWGVVLLAFGVFMVLGAARARRKT
jgi:hypothetical protein